VPAWTLVASLDVRLDLGCQPGRQLGLMCQPGPRPIPRFPHIYIVKVSLDFCLLFDEWHRRIIYISGRACLQMLGRKRERWATQLSRILSKARARDSEQHSTSSGSSLVTFGNPSFLGTYLLVLVDSPLAFALKECYILIVVYS
jgi:hypothetical protein